MLVRYTAATCEYGWVLWCSIGEIFVCGMARNTQITVGTFSTGCAHTRRKPQWHLAHWPARCSCKHSGHDLQMDPRSSHDEAHSGPGIDLPAFEQPQRIRNSKSAPAHCASHDIRYAPRGLLLATPCILVSITQNQMNETITTGHYRITQNDRAACNGESGLWCEQGLHRRNQCSTCLSGVCQSIGHRV